MNLDQENFAQEYDFIDYRSMLLKIGEEQNGSYCYVKCNDLKFRVFDLEKLQLVDSCNNEEEAMELRDSRALIDKFSEIASALSIPR